MTTASDFPKGSDVDALLCHTFHKAVIVRTGRYFVLVLAGYLASSVLMI